MFCFTHQEVDSLYQRYLRLEKAPALSREDLTRWYDGYASAAGVKLYNPRSIVNALHENKIANYWTSTGPYDEIAYYVKNDVDSVKKDMALLVAGEKIRMNVDEYSSTSLSLDSRERDLLISSFTRKGRQRTE